MRPCVLDVGYLCLLYPFRHRRVQQPVNGEQIQVSHLAVVNQVVMRTDKGLLA